MDNRFKYCDIGNISVLNECENIKDNNILSLDEKIRELELIAYSRVYDLIGASYELAWKNGGIHVNIIRTSYQVFWESNCDELPNIILKRQSY